MVTARERMLELSPLAPGATAREHLLAITTGGGGPVTGIALADFADLELEETDVLDIEMDEALDLEPGEDVTLDAGSDIELEADIDLEIDE